MSLITNSYFIGERNIPNTAYPEISSLVDHLIAVHERKYLLSLMGYELVTLFKAGLLAPVPDQRYTDILFGKEFTGLDGRLQKWNGLISVTEAVPFITVNLSPANDLFFRVGESGAPADGDDTYNNADLASANYRVIQRAFGPLEFDRDIEKVSGGGFKWLGTTRFSEGDTYAIQLLSAELDVSGVEIVPQPESPIADYVFYWYLRLKVNSASGTGQVQTDNANSKPVTSVRQQVEAYNTMVNKSLVLVEFLQANYQVYPEFQNHQGSREFRLLLTKISRV